MRETHKETKFKVDLTLQEILDLVDVTEKTTKRKLRRNIPQDPSKLKLVGA